MSSDESDDENDFDDIHFQAREIIEALIPKKSASRYHITYNAFLKWCSERDVRRFDEESILVYIKECSKSNKPTTLWSKVSMLKKMLSINQGIDLDKMPMIKAFLNINEKGYFPKKSKTFTWDQIQQFLRTANDSVYLAVKVCLVLGIAGCLRTQELHGIKLQDIEDDGHNSAFIEIPETKTYNQRSFVIEDEFYDIFKRYSKLRAPGTTSDKFLVNYQNGKCTVQNIGKRKIAGMPATIAAFLNCPDEKEWTGHCWRRTSATLLADAGATMTMLKRHGGWKSATVAEGYLADSKANKRRMFRLIVSSTVEMQSQNDDPGPPEKRIKVFDQNSLPAVSKAHSTAITSKSNVQSMKKPETMTSVRSKETKLDHGIKARPKTLGEHQQLENDEIPTAIEPEDTPSFVHQPTNLNSPDDSESNPVNADYERTQDYNKENLNEIDLFKNSGLVKMDRCTIQNFTIHYHVHK